MVRCFFVVVAGLHETAWACMGCAQGQAQSTRAYIVMTLIMSSLPLSMAGGLIAWTVMRARRQAAGQGSPSQPDKHALSAPSSDQSLQ